MIKIEQEAIKTDSNISSMRIAFFRIIWVIIGIAIVSVLAKIGLAFYNPTTIFDMSGITSLITALGLVAFGGKSIQSFSENGPITNPIQKVVSFFGGNRTQAPTSNPPPSPPPRSISNPELEDNR